MIINNDKKFSIVSDDIISVFRAMWINAVGQMAMTVICGLVGLVIFSEYKNCDPVDAGRIEKRDQVGPLRILNF